MLGCTQKSFIDLQKEAEALVGSRAEEMQQLMKAAWTQSLFIFVPEALSLKWAASPKCDSMPVSGNPLRLTVVSFNVPGGSQGADR